MLTIEGKPVYLMYLRDQISREFDDEGNPTSKGAPVITLAFALVENELAMGMSVCGLSDTPCKATGRTKALGRLRAELKTGGAYSDKIRASDLFYKFEEKDLQFLMNTVGADVKFYSDEKNVVRELRFWGRDVIIPEADEGKHIVENLKRMEEKKAEVSA